MPKRITRRRIKPALPIPESRDRFITCQSSLLADICETAIGVPDERPRFRFEVRGRVLGKNLGLKYGRGAEQSPAESYGVLVGRREPPSLHVLAFRHLALDWAGHSTDSLSEDDARVFAGLVAKVRWDPGFSGLQPVGWYRVHPHANHNLSARDLEISNRFFQEPWQIGLVLRPGTPVSGRFFFSEHTSRAQGRTSSRDIEIGKNSPTRVLVERLDPHATVVSRPPASSWPVRRRPRQKQRGLVWPAAVLVAGALSFGSWWMMRPPEDSAVTSRPKEPPVQDANQLASAQAEALWKKWQDEFNQVQGPKPQLPGPESPLPPGSTDVPDGDSATNTPAAGPDQAAPDQADKPAELTHAARSFPPARPSRKRASPDYSAGKRQAALHSEPMPPRSAVTVPGPPSPQVSRTEVPAPAPPPATLPPKPAAAEEIRHDEVAAIQPSTAEPAPQPVKPAPAPTVSRTVPATLPAPAVSRPPAPTAGRFIWTGRLRKNETLVLDGNKASAGSSNGGLPGTPIEVTVSPGDLTKDGMVIYSASNPSKSIPESPGPQNGWNKTRFEWAPDRAADIQVVEAPGPSNAWRRLAIRSKRSRDSIILVQWNTVR